MGAVEVTDADVRRARRAYYGNISYLDDWTARLMSTLHSVGAAEDTIVIVLADHGDMLGERGLWYKMNFFEGSARVPLIVHSPTRFAPKRISAAGLAGRHPADAQRPRPATPPPPASTRSPAARCCPCSRDARRRSAARRSSAR